MPFSMVAKKRSSSCLQHVHDALLLGLQLGIGAPISATRSGTILWKKAARAPSL
jgi:hypothetical protein